MVALAPPGIYYARVRGQYTFGLGPASNEVIVVAGASASPSNLVWRLDANRTVTLSWNPALGNVTHYILEAGTSAGMANVGVFAIGATSVVVPNVAPGSYHVRVRGVSSSGATAPSNEVVVVVP